MIGAAIAALGSFFAPVVSTVATVGSNIVSGVGAAAGAIGSGIGSAASAIGSGLSSAYGAASNYITGLTGSGAGTGINAGEVARTAGKLTESAGNLATVPKPTDTTGMFDKFSKYMQTDAGATTAQAVGGAAKGILDYMGKQKEIDMEREKLYYQKPWTASSGNADYGSHYQSLTKGLLNG